MTTRKHTQYTKEFKLEAIRLADESDKQANSYWVTDITFIPPRRGHLDLCVIMDLYSRAISGF